MSQTKQLAIDFEAGLLKQFPDFMDCVRASVHGCGRQFKAVAADLDMSSSDLSRKLAENPNDPVHFQLRYLPRLLRATGDLRPLHWLIEAFLEDPRARHARMRRELEELVPRLRATLDALESGESAGAD